MRETKSASADSGLAMIPKAAAFASVARFPSSSRSFSASRRMRAWSRRASPSISARFGGCRRRSCVPRGRGAVGGRQGGGIRARRSDVSKAASTQARARSVSRRCPRRFTSAPRCGTRASSSWPGVRREDRRGEGRPARAGLRRRSRAVGSARPSQARHGDGALGTCRLPSPTRDVVGVMSHPRQRRTTPLSRSSGRALPRGDVRSRHAHAPSANSARPPLRGGAVRRGSLWNRALRDLARSVPTRRGRPRARVRGSRTSLREATPAGREHRLGRRFVADRQRGSESPGRVCRRFSPDMTAPTCSSRERVAESSAHLDDALAVELDADFGRTRHAHRRWDPGRGPRVSPPPSATRSRPA